MKLDLQGCENYWYNNIIQAKEIQMSEDEKTLMAEYGITCEPKMIYFYKQYSYERLNDALRYAKIDARREAKNQDILTQK